MQRTIIATKAPPASGCLFVIAAPSGGGKTSLVKALLEREPGMRLSVSFTTRPPRPGERDGVDYQFIDDATFDRMVAGGEFAEWAWVHGNRYGTTVNAVREALSDGRDVLFDVDYQGGRQIKARFYSEAVLCFLLPPSLDELARRLRSRATDAPEAIERRPGDFTDLTPLEAKLPGVTSKLHFIEALLQPISSREIRRRVASGEMYRYYLAPEVYDYIQTHQLYQ